MKVSEFSVSMKRCLINRDVGNHLNYEHRVFNSEEFLKSREQAEQLFYRKVRTKLVPKLSFLLKLEEGGV